MNYLKILALPCFLAAVLFVVSCEQELKEHPLPASMKRQLEEQNNPAIQAKNVSGTITVSANLTNQASKSPTLFIFARSEGAQGGPPLAAKRLEEPKFPYQYSIGQQDTMLEGIKFEGRIKITARLDQDGIAGAGPGDIEGSVIAQTGDENADIVLDRAIEARKAPLAGKTISGTIRIDPKVAEKISRNAVLFIILRPIGQAFGPPLAVQLHEKGQFPLKYTIGQKDAVMPNTVVEGKVQVIARMDQDGNATSSPGDIEGSRLAIAGDEKVNIMINEVVGGGKTGKSG